jgi:hypothetical protein
MAPEALLPVAPKVFLSVLVAPESVFSMVPEALIFCSDGSVLFSRCLAHVTGWIAHCVSNDDLIWAHF